MKPEIRKGFKSAISVIVGIVAFVWFFTPIGPWKGFLVFACCTILLLILGVVYMLLDDEDDEMNT